MKETILYKVLSHQKQLLEIYFQIFMINIYIVIISLWFITQGIAGKIKLII